MGYLTELQTGPLLPAEVKTCHWSEVERLLAVKDDRIVLLIASMRSLSTQRCTRAASGWGLAHSDGAAPRLARRCATMHAMPWSPCHAVRRCDAAAGGPGISGTRYL